MAKYCMYCGQMNDDQALFCTACGKSFPAQQAAPPPAPVRPAPPAPSTVYTAELGPGVHKHMPTDVYLKDPQGNQLLVARLQSLLHRNFTIVDGSEAISGFIEEKTHLTHRTYTLQDADHSTLATVNVSNVEQNSAPPSCWMEDASGNRFADVVFTMGRLSFAVTKQDGSNFFEASMPTGGGMGAMMHNAARKAYSIKVDDPSMSLSMVLTVIAALDES
jgi:hypothetical protein